MLNDNQRPNINWNPNVTFPITLFKTIPICLTVIIILCLGDPDLIDGIIKVMDALAEFLKSK
jgi:hypothetical protein